MSARDDGHDAIAYAVLEQAAQWFAVLRAGPIDDGERARWQAWLASDPSHRSAWARVEAISHGMSLASAAPQAAGAALHAARQLRQRRKFVKTLVLAAATGTLGWQLARHDALQASIAGLGAAHRTGVGEVRRVQLADGTVVWLNTDTVLDQRYDHAQRLLVLHRGDIVVVTHADAQQPPRHLIVQSRHGTMRALGTRFEVRQFADHTRLGVNEGRVEVATAGVSSPPLVIAAGQETWFSRDRIAQPGLLDATRTAWMQGMLIANQQTLAQFLAELSRYRRGHLGCDPAVAALRVVGGFPLHDTDEALVMLAAALPVQVHAVLPWWVTVRAKK